MEEITIGVESEAQLFHEDGRPADTMKVLGGKSIKFAGKPFAEVTSDAARCSIEFVTGICRSEGEILGDLNFLKSHVPSGYIVRYNTTIAIPKGESHVPLADKARYPALWKAVQIEAPEGWQHMYQIAGKCSTQVHVGVNPTTAEGTSLLNFLNHIAPYAAVMVRKEFGVRDADGHCSLWSEFANQRRLPSPRWFTSPENLKSFLGAIPRMLKQDESGAWAVDLETPTRLGDPDAESTIWWLARPRGGFKTIEFRPFPSLMPPRAARLAGTVQQLALAYLNETHGECPTNPQEAAPVFTVLHNNFYMVPSRPLTDQAWRRYFQE